MWENPWWSLTLISWCNETYINYMSFELFTCNCKMPIYLLSLFKWKQKYDKLVGKEKMKLKYLKHMNYILSSSLLFSVIEVIINNLIKRFWQHNVSSSFLNRQLCKNLSHELRWFYWVMNYPFYEPPELISLFSLTMLTETVNSQNNKRKDKKKKKRNT